MANALIWIFIGIMIGCIATGVMLNENAERISEQLLDAWCKDQLNDTKVYFKKHFMMHNKMICEKPSNMSALREPIPEGLSGGQLGSKSREIIVFPKGSIMIDKKRNLYINGEAVE